MNNISEKFVVGFLLFFEVFVNFIFLLLFIVRFFVLYVFRRVRFNRSFRSIVEGFGILDLDGDSFS